MSDGLRQTSDCHQKRDSNPKFKIQRPNEFHMNFDLDDKTKTLCENIKGLFDHDAREALAQLSKEDPNQTRAMVAPWVRRLGRSGYLDLDLANDQQSVALLAVQETLAAFSPSLFLSVEASTRVFGRLIGRYGTKEQKAEVLQGLEQGRMMGAVALSEEGMNTENSPFSTAGTAVDTGWRVSGTKRHVVNGPIADMVAVAGNTEHGMVFFLIESGAGGFSAGERVLTLGFTGTPISPVLLEECFVRSQNLVVPFEGSDPLQAVRSWEDQIFAAAGLGLMQSAFDTAVAFAKTHKSGGKPIIAYQEVGFKLADMLTLLQTGRLLAYRAAWMTAAGDREASILVHCAKVFCAESAEVIASKALQILGEQGYRLGNPAEESYRDAKYLQIAGTSSEISRMKIGDELLARN
jgi:alkylation response protein AidB-like acyl-CoA dehydrogenase